MRVSYDNRSYVIAVLEEDKLEMANLNRVVDSSSAITFHNRGLNNVHLTGYFIKDGDNSLIGDSLDSSSSTPFMMEPSDSETEACRSIDLDGWVKTITTNSNNHLSTVERTNSSDSDASESSEDDRFFRLTQWHLNAGNLDDDDLGEVVTRSDESSPSYPEVRDSLTRVNSQIKEADEDLGIPVDPLLLSAEIGDLDTQPELISSKSAEPLTLFHEEERDAFSSTQSGVEADVVELTDSPLKLAYNQPFDFPDLNGFNEPKDVSIYTPNPKLDENSPMSSCSYFSSDGDSLVSSSGSEAIEPKCVVLMVETLNKSKSKLTRCVTLGDRVRLRYSLSIRSDEFKPYDRGIISFRVGQREVLRGLDEGVLGMNEGDIRRITIPKELGYSKGFPGFPELNNTLMFEVEVLAVS